MKKAHLLLGGVTILIAILCGCSARGTTTETKVGASFEGKTVIITLTENPSTGYTWSYAIADPNILSFSNDIYAPEDTAGKTTGSDGTHTYTFLGIAPGTTTITMTEKRDWEGGDIAQTQTFTVTVSTDGQIESIN